LILLELKTNHCSDVRHHTSSRAHHLIEKFSSSLNSLGIKEKDVVTLYASNSWEWIVSYFSIARIGAIINPVNTMLTPSEIKHVVNDCKAKAIIMSSDKVKQL
jgi:long-chain acyl-CoA synthetase